jgi:4-alpha-glucanotransferase
MPSIRQSGILLHPTSLPGRFGCGDLGSGAHQFLDFLASARQQLWQVLPLGPTGYGDSPYQSLSSFAGNPLLISPDRLLEDGLLDSDDLNDAPIFPDERVDFGTVIAFRTRLLHRSYERFAAHPDGDLAADFEAFCEAQAAWLDDFALFMALKAAHGGLAWLDWAPEVALRQPDALAVARDSLAESVVRHRYFQFLFFRQWQSLRQAAHQRGVRLIGDAPIFVAHDSADVWAHRELFRLDDHGRPTVVAGVPPDYFSATGQLWGNPIYDWDRLRDTGYRWWIERLRAALALVDLVRLDHFRGFAAYWEVPADAKTAVNGRWVAGSGADLFHALRLAFGVHHLPIIAEDLGVITPDVTALREAFELPGMKVLQFAFGGGDIAHMEPPYEYTRHCVVYTGTHDNDTALGWYRHSGDPAERALALAYMGSDGRAFNWDFIRLAMASVADTAIVPLQDVLGLDSDARMNCPGRGHGNWTWRYRPDALSNAVGARLAEMTTLFGRAAT